MKFITDTSTLELVLQDKLIGVPDSEIKEIIEECKKKSPSMESSGIRAKRQNTVYAFWTDPTIVKKMLRRIDADQDEVIVRWRKLPLALREGMYSALQSIEKRHIWYWQFDCNLLVLPQEDSYIKYAISVKELEKSTKFPNGFAQLVADDVGRLVRKHQLHPEFALGYLFKDEFYRSMEEVVIHPLTARGDFFLTRIPLSIDPSASDLEVLKAFSKWKSLLGLPVSTDHQKRKLRPRTYALVFFFAISLEKNGGNPQSLPRKKLMDEWNRWCRIMNCDNWTYTKSENHLILQEQFVRDIKYALEAVRGAKTEFKIRFKN